MDDLIRQIISHISNENIQQFFRQKISSFHTVNEDIGSSALNGNGNNFSKLIKLGEANYDNADSLLVFSCRFTGELTARSSKKKQFEIAKKVLKEDFKDGAIFIFYDDQKNFRFSFIRKNYGNEEERYSSWKRYTYFVSPRLTNKTFTQRISSCNFSSLNEILEAFKVEPLNREFYGSIVRSFYSLVGGEIGAGSQRERLAPHLSLPGGASDRTIIRQFGIRLIGRIIFCWFLKHKSSKENVALIPEDWLSSESVETNYYHNTLEPLFFEILNKEISKRKIGLPSGHKQIPFLNGGLFEAQSGEDSDYYDAKNKSNPSNYKLKISDPWFKELFEILEQYNFTIDENSINDTDVSIDPEMLGRIFENLLAEIDPNLESNEKVSVRKATGSYYTPREIVDYMTEEALVKYLYNRTGINEKILHNLFAEGVVVEFSNIQNERLLSAFDQVKILDPASGSGAFPMGALHKIVIALQKLDPGAEKWKAKQLNSITNAALKAEMKVILENANAEYARKLGVLQQCIYGADIQPIAAEISRLRGFLSLIVDEEIQDNKPNRGILPLPNLDFKFVTANTLTRLNNSGVIETDEVAKNLIPQLQQIRSDYLQAHGDEKENLRKQFQNIQSEILKSHLSHYRDYPETRGMQLAAWNPFKNEVTQWFDPDWMFGVKQFDIVIGNPPYGGTKISDELKNSLNLGSKDPYGAFIARYLHNPSFKTPLKQHGILAFIVSDTFMTIKTHKPLRDYILKNRIHSMIRVHPDTFKATVNTAVIICERFEIPCDGANNILMADFTNTSIHEQYDRFMQLLDKVTDYKLSETQSNEAIKKVHYMKGMDWTSESTEEFAVYTYPQNLIETNTNHPFFVASPKLFALMNDNGKGLKKEWKNIQGKQVCVRTIRINGKEIEILKLGEIADINQGLATGDNNTYLFQNIQARGRYRNIQDFKKFLLTEKDLDKIRNNEPLRLSIIDKGICKGNPQNERYFGGRYIIPYDKGGESDSEGGWLPNYYVPTNYFIDWSEWSVKRMRNYTIAQRIREYNELKRILPSYEDTTCAVFRSPNKYFKSSISFSRTGVYSPTFRLGSSSAFDIEGSMIFQEHYSDSLLLGILSSKLFRFLNKIFIGHTVHTQVDELKENVLLLEPPKIIGNKVFRIFSKQQLMSNYDYASHEQLSIDKLVYEAYGLNRDDIREIENWFARRYPKLSQAQKRNLQALGKPTDYVEIYKQLEKEEDQKVR